LFLVGSYVVKIWQSMVFIHDGEYLQPRLIQSVVILCNKKSSRPIVHFSWHVSVLICYLSCDTGYSKASMRVKKLTQTRCSQRQQTLPPVLPPCLLDQI